ncbi:MAG: DUF3466 family protein [Armatimonadota bacterium]
MKIMLRILICFLMLAAANLAYAGSGAFLWSEERGLTLLPLGQSKYQARDINSAGTITGHDDAISGSIWKGYVWDAENGKHYIGGTGTTSDIPMAINDIGQVAGEAKFGTDTEYRAFLWDNVNGMQNLGTLGTSQGWSDAWGISNNGFVTGRSKYSGNRTAQTHAFIWDSVNGMLDLGTLGGKYSHGYSVNDFGQVVGEADDVNGNRLPFIWDATGGMRSLGTLGGYYSGASSINNQGVVIGASDTLTSGRHAFIWDADNGIRDLGHFAVCAINDSNQVAGTNGYHAITWDSDNGVRELALPYGVSRMEACAINNAGEVVGYWEGTLPEPSACATLVIGLVGICGFSRRKS